MPILSVNIGRSEVSLLAFNSIDDFKVYNYPYVINDPSFLKELIKTASKELKIPTLAKYDLLVCGFPEIPDIGMEAKLAMTLDKVSASIKGFFPVFVSNFSILTASSFLSAAKLEYVDVTLSDFFPNLSIYPYLVPNDSLEQFTLDNFVRFFPNELIANNINVPMVFSGDRFGYMFNNDPLSYMLIFDLVKTLGVYELRVDSNNILANLAMIARYDDKYSNILAEYKFESLGVLINAEGTVEGLIETEDGTRQLFEVKNEQLFVVPLALGRNRIVLKNAQLGTIEKTVLGGTLGLIVDTRPKNNPEIYNATYIEKQLNIWANSVKEVITSL